MDNTLKVAHSTIIDSSIENVWEVLTNPEKIKIYLYGTETITDWEVGSAIIFQGSYEGHPYKDSGVIIENILHKSIKYSYWSGFSGLENKPENHSLVIYTLEQLPENKTKFTWGQEGFANEEGRIHSENGLPALLNQIKTLIEN